ncbi:GH1 family beta-glucosidase [Suilimivivens aceti]|uniref:Beta-glucosidase n=1 Tax=Suilimivivens aceti TaxID=2981774 RepID=A0ABT2SYT2_9FIRM|nr:GH1 family beta-glucosidase [Suilimivivens aceti]MCU6743161.1 GH1 family beta-glucosidase [Suilimivivens aceti]SCH03260.1 Beta-glucosidase A [uncultured Clostridium sp.]
MFRDDFVWGVASSAYQVEGRDPEDGCGKNIWDTFAEEGRILDGKDAYTACDHMHRYKEDYKLMKLLGIKAYRFSMSWARILPEGTGKVNEKAIAMYRDMILSMKENGIEPYITMYHWEFPQALQDKGGWLNEDVIQWFGEYAKVVAENFSDICEYFITLNEPECFVGLGHLSGVHAPGLKLPYKDVFKIAHNALRAHGQAVINLRKYASRPIKVGYAPTCGMAYPATDSPEDIEAARKTLFGFHQPMDNWTWNVAWFNDPVFLGKYPEEGLKKFAEYLPEITDEDMKLISQPLDFMGQNIYNGYMMRQGEDGEPEYVDREAGAAKTAAGWPVTPECFYYGVKFLYERYHLPLYITENGMSCHDDVSLDGRVHDPNRQNFLDLYISALQRANDDGADVRGYFLWTFLDNFEWDKGYTERFGIVYVDFKTQKRIVKDSAFWYQKIIESNGRELTVNKKTRPILFLNPVFKEMIWGGNQLAEKFGYEIPSDKTGECWAVSAHPNGDCTVREGEYAGRKLSELFKEEPELFGNLPLDRFPLLIKIIDAKADLSIQVHPDDAYAKVHENGSLGKTECWYILDCPEDATLVVGHNAGSREELKEMIDQKRWSELIREVPVKKGDFIQINPGTVHAIKGGLMILETQQNSDITYRVYDYDRLSNGKPRELHVQQSIDVITVPAPSAEDSVSHAADLPANTMNELIACDYYKVYKLTVTEPVSFEQEHPFLIMSVIEGEGLVNGQMIRKGDHFILPSGFGKVELQGDMTLIASSVK